MRQIRYGVAMSLDGFIAGPNGETDWITTDPEIDFSAIFARFDTILVGGKTFEEMARHNRTTMPGVRTIVISRTVKQSDYPNITVIAASVKEFVADLKMQPGKDIWLFGGGNLFRSLAEDGLVDAVEVAIIPVLLGTGVPLIASGPRRINLSLVNQKIYKSGIVSLEYRII